MGLCTILGNPDNFRGENLRSSTTARSGVGASDPKVSGILMVDSVLYMLVRNTGNSQLVWSTDHGPGVIESSLLVLVIRHFSTSGRTTLTQGIHMSTSTTIPR